MSDKPFKEKDWTDKALPIGVIVILFIVFLLGFVIKQPCDVDNQYLWCKFHPMGFFRLIGYIIFNAGAILLSGIWKKWFTLYNKEHTATWNLISFGSMVSGMLMVWFL